MPAILKLDPNDFSYESFVSTKEHRYALGMLIEQQAKVHNYNYDPSLKSIFAQHIGEKICKVVFSRHTPTNSICGMLVYTADVSVGGSILYMEDLIVEKAWRNHGVGTMFWAYAHELVRARGKHGMKWTTAATNEHAQAMFNKFMPENSQIYFGALPSVLKFPNPDDLVAIPNSSGNPFSPIMPSEDNAVNHLLADCLGNDWKDYGFISRLARQAQQQETGDTEHVEQAHIITVSRDNQGEVDGVIVGSRRYSTFECIKGFNVNLMAFRDEDTADVKLASMLKAVGVELKKRVWMGPIHFDTSDHHFKPQMGAFLQKKLSDLGAQVLEHDASRMVAGSVYNGRFRESLAIARNSGWLPTANHP